MKGILPVTLLAAAFHAQAQHSNTHFSYSLPTRAAPENIWRLWTDVAHWHEWDRGLQSARLLGPFALGVEGVLVPDKCPTSKFTIVALVPGESYTFKKELPLGALYVKRYLSVREGKKWLTHQVWFTGLSKGVFAKALGKNYRKMLLSVMERISLLAQNQ
jgi:hypothetical protein